MELNNTELNNQETTSTVKTKHHHRSHRHSSRKELSREAIYRNILLIGGFAMIAFSVTEESIALALGGSISIFLSLVFTDFYRRSFRALKEFMISLMKKDEEKHKHRRHHRHH